MYIQENRATYENRAGKREVLDVSALSTRTANNVLDGSATLRRPDQSLVLRATFHVGNNGRMDVGDGGGVEL